MAELDPEERRILDSFEAEEWSSVPDRAAEVKRFQEYAAHEPVRLSPAEEAELLEAAEQIEAGEFVDGQDLLNELWPRTGE